MSAATENWNPGRSAAGEHSPWLITFVVSIATFMEVLDITIVNVALRHIAGKLAVSLDESTWVLTSYLIANAVAVPISGWLSTFIGRKRFYMLCVAVFTLASFGCGLAWNFHVLLFFRILQGLGGGGMAPSEQSILADSFPPEKRGLAFSVYGIAVVVAPAVGPALGGVITDNLNWYWVFLINVPMGILSLILVGLLVVEPEGIKNDRRKILESGIRFDWPGLIFVAVGLGFLEVVLDRGQQDDWFASSFITSFALISAVSLLALVFWEMRRKDPIIEIKLLFTRQFGTCFLLMLGLGMILIGSTQLIPQLVQTEFGYDATLAGLTLSLGGFLTMFVMPVVGQLSSRVQPKYLMVWGAAVLMLSMLHMTTINSNITFEFASMTRIYLAFGLPFLFIPITAACYEGLPEDKTNQASALINVARNLGGSIGVATAQTLLAQRHQFHQSRLVENFIPSNPQFQAALHQATQYFMQHGNTPVEAAHQAMAWAAKTMALQATLLSYIDTFWVFAMVAAVMIPLAFAIRHVHRKSPPGH